MKQHCRASRVVSTTGLTIVIAAVMVAVCGQRSEASWVNTQKVYGPLILALDEAYATWLDQRLGSTPPAPDSFTASVDASTSPFTITFTSTTVALSDTYHTAPSEVTEATWPAVPSSHQSPKGPISLSGLYVRALVAAYEMHVTYSDTLGDAYASLDSPGSSVVITKGSGSGKLLVGFDQYFDQSGLPMKNVGCWKEQNYFVDPATLVATRTTVGCP